MGLLGWTVYIHNQEPNTILPLQPDQNKVHWSSKNQEAWERYEKTFLLPLGKPADRQWTCIRLWDSVSPRTEKGWVGVGRWGGEQDTGAACAFQYTLPPISIMPNALSILPIPPSPPSLRDVRNLTQMGRTRSYVCYDCSFMIHARAIF